MAHSRSKQPLVSFCMPVYNEQKYIADTLECLKKQTYRNIEVLILDNCSTDDTPEICRKFTRDRRFRLMRNGANIGQVHNFNRCYGMASGDFVALLSGNDLVAPDYTEKLLEPMLREPGVGLSYAKCRFIDEDSNPIRSLKEDAYFTTDVEDPVNAATVVMARFFFTAAVFGLYRRDLIERLQPFRHTYGSDAIFVCEASLYASIRHSDEELFSARQHGQIKDLVNLHSEDWVRRQPSHSSFQKFERLTPYIDLLWGHLDMIGRAQIGEKDKGKLCQRACVIFRGRFGKYMDVERDQIFDGYARNEKVLTGAASDIRYVLLRLNFLERVKRAVVALPDDERLRDLAKALVGMT